MKIKLRKPRDFWISPYTIVKYLTFNRYKPSIRVVNYLNPISKAIQKICITLYPKDKIKIDNYDLWGLDYSLAKIILPALIILKEERAGSHFVDDCDVPEGIKSTDDTSHIEEWEIDVFFHKRCMYVLGEMIYSFNKILEDSSSLSHDERKRVSNGLKLFGKYYQGLWA